MPPVIGCVSDALLNDAVQKCLTGAVRWQTIILTNDLIL